VVGWPDWVNRRVEQIGFVDEDTIHRVVSIDLTLPGPQLPSRLKFPLPVAWHRKSLLRNFSLRDEVGIALPIATRAEHAHLSGVFLTDTVNGVLRGRRGRSDLLATAYPLLRKLPYETDLGLSRILVSQINDCGRLWNTPPSTPGEKLMYRWITLFQDYFLLLVPLKYRIGQRRIIKMSFDQPISSKATPGSSETPAGGFSGRPKGTTVKEPALGIELTQAGLAGSYHVEISAPEQLRILDPWIGTPRSRLEQGPGFREEQAIHGFYAYMSGKAPPDTEVGFYADFELRPGGAQMTALIAAWFTLAVLLAGCVVRILGFRPTGQGALSILLALPALYSVFLIERNEHRLVKPFLDKLRTNMLLCALISVVAAAAFIVSPSMMLFVGGGISHWDVAPRQGLSLGWRSLSWSILTIIAVIPVYRLWQITGLPRLRSAVIPVYWLWQITGLPRLRSKERDTPKNAQSVDDLTG
jgi:hypothetical protein